MGKPDGFLLYSRREDSERACAERINDYAAFLTASLPSVSQGW